MSPSNTCTLRVLKFVLSLAFCLSSAPAFSENPFVGATPESSQSCSRFRVFLRAPVGQESLGVKTLCQLKSNELHFSISFPDEAELINSNLFEIAGKGESWRSYNLGKLKKDETILAEFLFSRDRKSYRYRLVYKPIIKKEQLTPTPPREQRLRVGGTFSSLKISQADFEAKDSKPGLLLKTLHYPLFGQFGVGALLDLPVSLSSSEKTISFSQVEMMGSYEWIVSSGFHLRPKVGFGNFNFVNDSTNIGMSGSALLAGLGFDFGLSDGLWLSLDGASFGLIGGGIKRHYAVDVAIYQKSADLFGYGLGVRMQSFGGLNSEGVERTLSQMSFQGFLIF